MRNRAYAVLNVKSIDDNGRTFSGVATTPTVDREGDIIEPLGVEFQNPLPLLWQHEHDKPIGNVEFSKPTEDGIDFTASISSIEEPGRLKDRLDEAWQSIRVGLVRAVSIGFRSIEHAIMDTGGIRFLRTEVYELSAVTIPANAEALITSVKSIDAELRRQHNIPEPEIPVIIATASSGNRVRVVKLDEPARDRAPFVINKINPRKGKS